MRRFESLILMFVLFMFAGPAHAQRRRTTQPTVTPGVEVSISEWPADREAPGDTRYLRVITWRSTLWPDAQAKLDRRLVAFELVPASAEPRRRASRPVVCAHPERATAERSEGRAQALAESSGTYSEWIDLREYCSGDARRMLERGAQVRAYVGGARPRRRAWVAKSPSRREQVARLDAGMFAFAPIAAPVPPGPVIPTLVPSSAASAPATFAVSVTSRSRGRIYVRADQFSFHVRGPLGELDCRMPTTQVVPLRDFFETVGPGRRIMRRLEARAFCGDAFLVDGIYEITPSISLPYRGPHDEPQPGILTGDFVGSPSAVRVQRGRGGYVERPIADRPIARSGGNT